LESFVAIDRAVSKVLSGYRTEVKLERKKWYSSQSTMAYGKILTWRKDKILMCYKLGIYSVSFWRES